MAVQIQLRRGPAAEWTSANPVLAEGEIAVELDTSLFKIGNGITAWRDLPYGGIRGYAGSSGYVGSFANMAVANVLYVSKSGNDGNDGISLNSSKLTLRAALEIATPGTTIFVKSGDYTEINPMIVPRDVAVVGDNLRTVTIRPAFLDQDLFWVNNGCYLAHMTFKDHIEPAAAVAFNPDGSAGIIMQSPYVQNCTSITSTGTGMRIDGRHALGTKSMVVDAYTQYNQGGIGIHLLNRGYAQLVSVFTICCDKGFFAESGGFCSITNSNSSFGNYALYADGVSDPIQTTTVVTATGRTAVLSGINFRPSIGDALQFANTSTYFTVNTSTGLRIGSHLIVQPTIANENANLRNARQFILNRKAIIQVETTRFLNETYPTFQFNSFKCNRDVETMLNAVCYDMCFGSNYQSVASGIAYRRNSSKVVVNDQLTETLAAIQVVKSKALATLTSGTLAYTRVSDNFDIILDILENGLSAVPVIVYPSPTVVEVDVRNAVDQIQVNKDFIQAEAMAYVAQYTTSSSFNYNQDKCYRDTGLIVDAIAQDLLFGGQSQITFAGVQYYTQGNYTGHIPNQITTTTAAINYVSSLAQKIVQNITTGTRYQSTITQTVNNLTTATLVTVGLIAADFKVITDILTSGTNHVTDIIVPNRLTTSTNSNVWNAYNLLQANKTYLQSEAIAFIEATKTGFNYNQVKCYRDTGLIVDSLAFDLLYSGTSQSVFAGLQYWNQTGLTVQIPAESTATLAAISNLKSITLALTEVSSYSTASTSVLNNFNKILSIFGSGTAGVSDLIVPNGSTSTNAQMIDAYNAIQSNKRDFQLSTIEYISNNFPDLAYNPSKFIRDFGYILDSISFDLLHGGNRQSIMSGVYYYNFSTSTSAIVGETTQTVAAYNYIKSITANIVKGIAVTTTYQNTITQTISASTATNIEVAEINSRVDLITNIILNGPSVATTRYPIGLIQSSTATIKNAFDLLISNKTFIQAETVAYINATNSSTFEYDRVKCRRDIGYMVDSVSFDLVYGGNKQAVQSGVLYYSYTTSTQIVGEIPETIAAYNYITALAQNIVTGTRIETVYQRSVEQTRSDNTGTSAEVAVIGQLIGTLTNIISSGTTVAPAFVPIPLTQSTSTYVRNAATLLKANRKFIQEEIIAYINNVYSTLQDQFEYEVIYTLDSISYDMLYGGNSQITVQGELYYNGHIKTVAAELTNVLSAYNFINSLTQKVIQGITVTPLQNTIAQDTLSIDPASSGTVAILTDKFGILSSILTNGYTISVTFEENVRSLPTPGELATFYQYSLIVSTGHSFEWIGAGVNIDSALPYLGGEPITANQGFEINGGRVYFTGTDQRGDFRIGNDLVINRNNGTISGRTFTKSLFAVMTPYILSIGS